MVAVVVTVLVTVLVYVYVIVARYVEVVQTVTHDHVVRVEVVVR